MTRPSLPTHRQFTALLLILAAGSFVRFYQIAVPSLWMDELVSIELAMGNRTAHDFFPDAVIRSDQPDVFSLSAAAPWWDIWNRVQITTHPPIYFVVLRWWMDIFGNGAGATRCLSAVFSLAGIAVFFDVCRLLHGSRTGLLAACIMALAIGQIDIAQEARSYPLLILLGMCCCDLLVRITLFGTTPRRVILLGCFLATMLLTHYFAVGAWIALAVYAAIRLGGSNRRRTLVAFLASALIALLAWGYQFYWQTKTIPNFDPSYTRESLPNHALQTLLRAAQLPLDYLCGDLLGQGLPLLAHVAAAMIVIVLVLRVWRRPDLLLWTLWGLGVVFSVAAGDLAHDSILLHYTRYTILASPALFALIASVDWRRLRYLRDIFPLGVIASLAVLTGLRVHQGVPAKQDFQGLSRIIDSNSMPDELLVFYNDSGWVAPGVWYMGYKYYAPASQRPWVTLRHAPDAELLARFNQLENLWLIGRQTEIDGPKILPGWEVEEYWQTSAGHAALMRHALTPVH